MTTKAYGVKQWQVQENWWMWHGTGPAVCVHSKEIVYFLERPLRCLWQCCCKLISSKQQASNDRSRNILYWQCAERIISSLWRNSDSLKYACRHNKPAVLKQQLSLLYVAQYMSICCLLSYLNNFTGSGFLKPISCLSI